MLIAFFSILKREIIDFGNTYWGIRDKKICGSKNSRKVLVLCALKPGNMNPLLQQFRHADYSLNTDLSLKIPQSARANPCIRKNTNRPLQSFRWFQLIRIKFLIKTAVGR